MSKYDWIKEQYTNFDFKEKKEKMRLVLTRKRKKKMLKIIRHMYQVMSEVEDYTIYAGIMNSLVLMEEELTGVSSEEILEKLPKKHNIKEVDFT